MLIDHVPDLMEWYDVYHLDSRTKHWIRWNGVDVQRYGIRFLLSQIEYCKQSNPNEEIRVVKVNRKVMNLDEIYNLGH